MPSSLRHPTYPKLFIFKQPNGKSRNWYAGFHHGGKHHRRSLKTEVWDRALAGAASWYEKSKYELKHGSYVAPSAAAGPKFQSLIDRTLRAMASRGRSEEYIKSVGTALGKTGYVRRFFGELSVAKITTRTWDDFRIWLSDTRAKEEMKPHSERTIHQMKNTVQLVLGQAYDERHIESVPRFADRRRSRKKDSRPRVYFNVAEYASLRKFAKRNIRDHETKKTRWPDDARELRDYIVWMVNTGLRVGECRALRFKDVRIVMAPVLIKGVTQEREVCEVTVTKGKQGPGAPCVSYLTGPAVFRRIVARRGIEDPSRSDAPIFKRHHREAFKRLLREHGLYEDAYGRKRDFVSLRHTYICFRLMAGVPAFHVAKNVRTSVSMIENHYAKALGAVSLSVNITN